MLYSVSRRSCALIIKAKHHVASSIAKESSDFQQFVVTPSIPSLIARLYGPTWLAMVGTPNAEYSSHFNSLLESLKSLSSKGAIPICDCQLLFIHSVYSWTGTGLSNLIRPGQRSL